MNFFEKVYEIVKKIPYGKVASYGRIAILCGNPRMARQVGWALHKNPYPDTIPCYRVVTKNGYPSKSFAFGGEKCQIELLKNEGIEFVNNHIDMDKYSI